MTSNRTSFDPIPLEDAPEVNALLERIDFGPFVEETLTSYLGRNDIWAGSTESGREVFVKRVTGPTADVRSRLRRIAAVDELISGRDDLPTPKCHAVDTETGLVAFELLEDVVNGAELAKDDLFTEELAADAGRVLAALHSLDVPEGFGSDGAFDGPEPARPLTSIDLETYASASAGELDLWRLLHDDQEVATALGSPIGGPKRIRSSLIHGDLRLDQFLSDGDILYLTDWEEARPGDPAADIGAFAGEWLHRGVLAMSTAEDDPVAGGTRRFELLRSNVEEFWAAYLAARPEAGKDLQLPVRATAHVGHHLFTRVLAASQQSSYLTPLQKAAAGVGRQALLKPEDYTTAIGLGGRP
ncbi:class V lanthionine synthetase subunit LxmK [Nocardiopsis ganjiahuensis]|uniref:class V lanthionine synthetase subunit LxmK n=1 Tax=Nocardiopsis ganjiahuensis TaxID=239984 RepID=UPI00034597E5|nr:class V lanthionine synthetase subunit LxmK [Nocardiopsis ganjiahuensis]